MTGRENYEDFATYIGDEKILTEGADYVAKNYAWEVAGFFWEKRKINSVIDDGGDSLQVSYKVSEKINYNDTDTFDARYNYYLKVSEIIL